MLMALIDIRIRCYALNQQSHQCCLNTKELTMNLPNITGLCTDADLINYTMNVLYIMVLLHITLMYLR